MTDVIRELPSDDRPRERLLTHGAATLSDAELVAILLGSGVQGKNAIQLAREVLAEAVKGPGVSDLARLSQINGVGPAKAARLVAAFEIAQRQINARPEEPPPFDIDVTGRKLVTTYGRHTQERLGVVFLDARHRVKTQREIYVGTINNALVSTRDIVKYGLLGDAVGVVVFHNHPSGHPSASEEDINFTRKLQESLGFVDLELVDHLIVAAHGYCSMRRMGLIA
ncbi:MAG TPA: DNA repair protein RadC [Thermoanaerobaculia bacterium]|jgi:DNA repair protein RadC